MRSLQVCGCLLITALVWTTVKSEGLIQLLDEILQNGAVAESSYKRYDDRPLEYVPASQTEFTRYEPVRQSTSQPDYFYDYSVPASYSRSPVDIQAYGKEGYGYSSPQTYGSMYQPTTGYQQQQQQSYGYRPSSQSYGYRPSSQSYGYQSKQPSSYQQKRYGKAPKVKKVYVPVLAKKKKKKKMKIISVQKGFYISGGTQLFGKYKSLYACEKACAATPNCFAGDYNPWFKKCYVHSNYTACGTLRAHKKLVHFKKVPCTFPEAPMGRVMLGVQIFQGVEQKGIKSLSDCLKHCATAGNGIQARSNEINDQICYGIDYDFGRHTCFFHVDNNYPAFHFCPANGQTPPVPRDTVANPSVISILLCPGPYVG